MITKTREAPPGATKPTGGTPEERQAPNQGHPHYIVVGAACKPSGQEAITVTVNPLLESTVRALNALSPKIQELAALLVRQLAGQEGITAPAGPSPGLQVPAEGLPLWIAKMKQESFSRRTIEVYELTVRKYLKQDPMPTKLSLQQYLAERIGQVSTSRASNELKSLKSFFAFLHEEGLWHVNPMSGIKGIRVRYRARELPDEEGIRRLLGYECYRAKNTPKFRTMLTLLLTTGLRVSEAAGLLKKDIHLDRAELKIIGKGGKEGIVPMLPVTMDVLRSYMESRPNDSPHLFPGDTEVGYWSIWSFERSMRRACRKLSIKRITPHQLRHYYATVMLRGGVKAEVVSKILRHASVGITLDIYRHVLMEEMHEAAEGHAPLNGTTMLLKQ